jgi:hypothetical protein
VFVFKGRCDINRNSAMQSEYLYAMEQLEEPVPWCRGTRFVDEIEEQFLDSGKFWSERVGDLHDIPRIKFEMQISVVKAFRTGNQGKAE